MHIELTDIYDKKVYVNHAWVEDAIFIGHDEVGETPCTVIQVSETLPIHVKESPEEIFAKVNTENEEEAEEINE